MKCPFCNIRNDEGQSIVLANEHCFFIQKESEQDVLKGSGLIIPKAHMSEAKRSYLLPTIPDGMLISGLMRSLTGTCDMSRMISPSPQGNAFRLYLHCPVQTGFEGGHREGAAWRQLAEI